MNFIRRSTRVLRLVSWSAILVFVAFVSFSANSWAAKKSAVAAAPVNDEEYGKKIREYTTEPRFNTELTDHLPASSTVTCPEKFLGYIIGTPKKLTHIDKINGYMRELERTAPKRVRVLSIGKSEEGREMIAVVVTSEENLAKIDELRGITAKLSDPRKLTDDEAGKLVALGKPVYYATGSIHSPETGSPEMLMELCYRLAVEETPFVQAIRKNLVFVATPVLETDGHDRMVDVYNYKIDHPDRQPPSLVYWGKYVAHDNNRDSMVLTLNLSNNILHSFHDYWHGTVLHDLHESVPYLYTSTGTGPYNASLDPIQIDEWQTLSYQEITEMAKRGLPGVWTHGFYDGWVPNYMFYVANGRNAIGRFYETFGNGGADTQERTLPSSSTSREWYRPNPPLSRVQWSIRNNINYQQSALLIALKYVADHKDTFLENYWIKSKNAVERVKRGGYPAWIFPADQPRKADLQAFMGLMQKQGLEVNVLKDNVELKDGKFAAGSYVIRMDQPLSNLADMLLGVQEYRATDPMPYDDTGWTMPWLAGVKHAKVMDKKILDASMELFAPKGFVGGKILSKTTGNFIVEYHADSHFLPYLYSVKDIKILAAEEPFDNSLKKFPAGTLLIPKEGNPAGLKARLDSLGNLGMEITEVDTLPNVKTHELAAPRIALLHSWLNTQNEGWWRVEFDQYKIPYTYISDQKMAKMDDLRKQFDVIVFPQVSGNPQSVVNGVPMVGKFPVPWKKTDGTPNLGGPDETDDMRGGMGLEGLAKLQKFVNDGGLLILEGSNDEIPIDFGLVRGVSVANARELRARGDVLRATIADKKSPIMYGYTDDSFAVYFNQSPLLQVGGGMGFGGGFGGFPGASASAATPGLDRNLLQGPPPLNNTSAPSGEAQAEPQRGPEAGPDRATLANMTPGQREVFRESQMSSARLVLKFADEKTVLMSGQLVGASEVANKAAVVDCPVGKGHIVLFAIHPFWRAETVGSYALVWNAIMNYEHLDVGRTFEQGGGEGRRGRARE
ncbi:MAG: M14 family zinc carboxypeptidase [Acidobacteriia bacterium]|nr:M14 family zinc carboxypeptidase [Terriglobia bacterium]